MRRFRDRDGQEWDVVPGRESWGLTVALFVPVSGSAAIRHAPLRSASTDTAALELDRLDDAALQALLDRSKTRDDGGI